MQIHALGFDAKDLFSIRINGEWLKSLATLTHEEPKQWEAKGSLWNKIVMIKLLKTLDINPILVLSQLFVMAIPLSQVASSYLLVSALLVGIVTKLNFRTFNKAVSLNWDLLFFFALLIAGLIYTTNLSYGVKVIESNLSFLAVPLLFACLNFSEKNTFDRLLFSFKLGLYAACIICLTGACVKFRETQAIDSFFYYGLTEVLNFQPTYFAYFLIFGITHNLYLLYYNEEASKNLFRMAGTLFLFFVLILTAGQTTFISLLLVFSFFLLKFFLELNKRKKRFSVVIIVFMLLATFGTSSLQSSKIIPGLTDSWDRMALWNAVMKANPDPFFGVGIGDYKQTLNEYYRQNNLSGYAEQSYNPHNQILQVYLAQGLVGVGFFLFLILRLLYKLQRADLTLGILFFFPFLVYGVNEVFLGRYQGVVFFVLIHQVCIYMIMNHKEKIAYSTI